MVKQAEDTSVHSQVVVEAPIAEAFSVFTEGIGTWMPPEYNLLPAPIAERVLSLASAAASTTVEPTAANVTGPACWCTSRPTASLLAGRLVRNGKSKRTLRRSAKSR
jgi:hypothetical protein